MKGSVCSVSEGEHVAEACSTITSPTKRSPPLMLTPCRLAPSNDAHRDFRVRRLANGAIRRRRRATIPKATKIHRHDAHHKGPIATLPARNLKAECCRSRPRSA